MSSKSVRIPGLSGGGGKGKKVLVVGLLVLAIYLVVRDPVGAAESVRHVVDAVQTFVHGIGGGA